MDNNGANIVSAFGLVFVGLLFYIGYFRNKIRPLGFVFNFDVIFIPNIDSEDLIIEGDKIAFYCCALFASLELLSTLVSLVFPDVPNIGLVFFATGLLLAYPLRIFFIRRQWKKSIRNG
jgi:hypothetical protein